MAASCRSRRPSKPSRAKRSCQRQTQVLDLGRLAHDRARAQALDRQEHDLRPPDVLLRRVSVFNESVKPIEIGGRDGKRNAGSHPPDSHAATQPGIRLDPIVRGIQLSDLIH